MNYEHDSDAGDNPYSRQRIANLMAQFQCSRETASRIVELRAEGYNLRTASIMAGAADPEERPR